MRGSVTCRGTGAPARAQAQALFTQTTGYLSGYKPGLYPAKRTGTTAPGQRASGLDQDQNIADTGNRGGCCSRRSSTETPRNEQAALFPLEQSD
jgi:hypothetical protein